MIQLVRCPTASLREDQLQEILHRLSGSTAARAATAGSDRHVAGGAVRATVQLITAADAVTVGAAAVAATDWTALLYGMRVRESRGDLGVTLGKTYAPRDTRCRQDRRSSAEQLIRGPKEKQRLRLGSCCCFCGWEVRVVGC